MSDFIWSDFILIVMVGLMWLMMGVGIVLAAMSGGLGMRAPKPPSQFWLKGDDDEHT